MFKQKLFIALLLPFVVAAVGCGGSDGDNVNITVSDPVVPPPVEPPPVEPGDCDKVVPATFVSCDVTEGVATLKPGTIDADYTLVSAVPWRLAGAVTVGNGNQTVNDAAGVQALRDNGVTLTIEPGTNIRAFDTGALLITRGSKLVADGTAAEPITFSSIDDNFDGLGEWGGVIIQGFAPQYGRGDTGPCYGSGEVCNVEGEGGEFVGRYGGNDPSDNSGTMRYVRIAEGGYQVGPNNEINGLTLQGVGFGTTIDYIQVHNNLDDGIEWFGGTVNVRHAVLTNNDDDDIDYDEGYKGNIQYALIQKNQTAVAPQGSNDPRGIEANSNDKDFVPDTNAVLANITIIGGPVNNATDKQQPGMRLRGAVTTTIYNSSVSSFNIGCVRIDSANVNGDGSLIVPSDIGLTNILGDCQDGFYEKGPANVSDNVQELVLTYSDTMAIRESAAQLSAAPVINAMNNGSGFVFDQTDYVGAVDPNGDAWWQGWTLPGTVSAGEPVQEPVLPASFVSCEAGDTICTLTGTIDQDYTLVAGVEWRLSGPVIVGTGNAVVTDVQAVRDAGVTLTIRPSVQVRAFNTGSLLVTRGSKLMAEGTVTRPITFSSLQDTNLDGQGEWGGVIIQGFAPQYGRGGTGACFGSGTVCNVLGEGGSFVGNYGGSDPADNSGSLRFVRIAEGGFQVGPNNEINGLTLQGVGHGTTIEYIQVHSNLDDGIEWFGGTVNVRHAVLTNNDDDDIDFDEGYKGNIQYVIVRKDPNKTAPSGSNDPRGIEANSDNNNYVPETDAALANILILGSAVNNSTGVEQPGMRLRGAVNVDIYNTAVRNFNKGCIRIDDADTNGDTTMDAFSNVNLVNILGECTGGFYDPASTGDPADSNLNSGLNSVTVDAAYALTDAAATVTAPTITAVDNGSGFTFESNDYVGAVAPGTAAGNAWWAGWIIEGSLD